MARGSATRFAPVRVPSCVVEDGTRLTRTSLVGTACPELDWEQSYRLHSEALLRYLVKLTGDREVAGELTQEAFVRAIRTRPDLDGPGAARAWLFRVATNLARSDARRRALFRFVPFASGEAAVQDRSTEEREIVRTALRSIQFDQAATLLLHYQSGFDRAEIAAMHGVAEETVKSRIARGRKNFIASYRRLQRGLAR